MAKCSIDPDVIMVWHSFMLNPRCYLEDCLRYNKIRSWRSGFPWDAINSCIDNATFEFTGTKQAQRLFAKDTGLSWDNLDDPLVAHIGCPKCKHQMSCPWTTSGSHPTWYINGGERGDGFADRNFRLQCPSCEQIFDHDVLRACKFRTDVERLMLKDAPMPGTVLKIDGMAASVVGLLQLLTLNPVRDPRCTVKERSP